MMRCIPSNPRFCWPPSICLLCLLLATVLRSSLTAAEDRSAWNQIASAIEAAEKLAQGEESPNEAPQPPRFRVLAFLGSECPLANLYGSKLQSLRQLYQPRGVEFVAFFSNLQDSEKDMAEYVRQQKLDFAAIKDWDQRIARHFAVKRTSEVVLVDGEGNVHYQGRIDDQYAPGIQRSQATTNDLSDAIDQLLAGRAVARGKTESQGCLITYRKGVDLQSTVTFCRSIAPILIEHCVECHRPGEIGPFSMNDYEEVRGWAEMMVETVEQGRMPPWHAAAGNEPLKNERHFPRQSLDLLKAWVEAGTPYGDRAELPSWPQFANHGWRMPIAPEKVIGMAERPYAVPAKGTVDYQYFVVDPGFEEDVWISSAEIIPGNPAVVHHAIVFIRPPDGTPMSGIGWLTAYVPGQRSTTFPGGQARRVPAGSKFVFQMHYTPNGTPQTDRSQLGLCFADPQKITHEVITLIAIDQDFEIPAGRPDHPVRAQIDLLPEGGRLLAAIPHMHLRGKSFLLTALQGNQKKTLLEVPRYDFNWQHTYQFREPIDLDQVDGIEFVATFDNSRDNPANPDAGQVVMWGDQTWEEMAVAFFEVSVPRAADGENRRGWRQAGGNIQATMANTPSSPRIDADRYADEFLRRFDRNGDGFVHFAEATRIVQDYSFQMIDRDSDRRVTREELLEASRTLDARK
jgi:hypothetical protein